MLGPGWRPAPRRGGKGSRYRDHESENVPAAADSHRHPAGGTRRDGTRRDGRDEGEGRPAPRGRAGSALLAPPRRLGPSCHLAAGEGGGAEGRVRGKSRRTRTPRPRELSSPGCFTRTPSGFPFLLSFSRRSSSATWASRDTGLSRHVTRERLRWGGLWPLLPALRKRNTERACAMGAWSAVSQSVRYWFFLFRNRRLGGKSFFAYLSLP